MYFFSIFLNIWQRYLAALVIKIFYVLDIVALAFNPSTWEKEVGRSL